MLMFSFLVSPKFLTTDAVFAEKIQENVSLAFRIYCNPKDITAKIFVNGFVTNNNVKYMLVITEGVLEELKLTFTIVGLDNSDLTNYTLEVTNCIGKSEVNFTVIEESKFKLFGFHVSVLSTIWTPFSP